MNDLDSTTVAKTTKTHELITIINFIRRKAKYFSTDFVHLLAQYAGLSYSKNDVSAAIRILGGKKLITRTDRLEISKLKNGNSLAKVIWRTRPDKDEKGVLDQND